MGGALLEGMAHARPLACIGRRARSFAAAGDGDVSQEQKIECAPKSGEFLADAIVIAVKPQMADAVVPKLAPFLRPKTGRRPPIMAGRTIASLEKHLPAGSAVRARHAEHARICRHGITVAVGNKHVDRGGKLAPRICSAPSARWSGSRTSV